MTGPASEPGEADTRYGPPRLLSRWEFDGTTYLLVTASADDDGNLTLKYMPEDAYRKWSALHLFTSGLLLAEDVAALS
jgi:hypothetical protein